MSIIRWKQRNHQNWSYWLSHPVFRNWNLIFPATLIVKLAVCRVVLDVVIVEPACCITCFAIGLYHNCQVQLASVPYKALQLLQQKRRYYNQNLLRGCHCCVPRGRLCSVLPVGSRIADQCIIKTPEPEASVTLATAYAVLVPVSKSLFCVEVALAEAVFRLPVVATTRSLQPLIQNCFLGRKEKASNKILNKEGCSWIESHSINCLSPQR